MTAAPRPLPLAAHQQEAKPDPARFIATRADFDRSGVCFRVSVKHLALIVVVM